LSDHCSFSFLPMVRPDTDAIILFRSLPQTLVIQLKRFNYDWETNRAVKFDDYFKFPWSIDMTPYTTDGIQAREENSSPVRPLLRRNQYELVGVVVHSGQANAGHYYSYIRDRRPPQQSKQNHNRWFKFNDTTVERFNMTDDAMATECFGGSFKASKKENSSLPETRQRYWNAYMLVYETTATGGSGTGSAGSSQSRKTSSTTPKKTMSVSRHPNSARKISASSRISEPAPPAARESLSELSNLLEKGEKKGLFGNNRMPASIERGVQEENLRFLDNRDVYCTEYYSFVQDLLNSNVLVSRKSSGVTSDQYDSLCVDAVRLGVNFVFNTYFHLKTRKAAVLSDVTDAVAELVERSCKANEHLLAYFASNDEGLQVRYVIDLDPCSFCLRPVCQQC
jgi:ubiquitin carboxyl-terminal hydrolase 9/24